LHSLWADLCPSWGTPQVPSLPGSSPDLMLPCLPSLEPLTTGWAGLWSEPCTGASQGFELEVILVGLGRADLFPTWNFSLLAGQGSYRLSNQSFIGSLVPTQGHSPILSVPNPLTHLSLPSSGAVTCVSKGPKDFLLFSGYIPPPPTAPLSPLSIQLFRSQPRALSCFWFPRPGCRTEDRGGVLGERIAPIWHSGRHTDRNVLTAVRQSHGSQKWGEESSVVVHTCNPSTQEAEA
jgi:hypothetical protein